MKGKESKTMKMKEENLVEVLPLKDFTIKQNDIFIELKEGELKEIPFRFLVNLKTENVIKE
jgi:hypothetical protein